LIRLVAAGAVLVSHNFPLLGLREPAPIAGLSVGTIAVFVFFGISGFLICGSLQRSTSVVSFAVKRILRIYPGLVVALIFCAFLIGPIFTTLPIVEYVFSREPWLFVSRFFGASGEDRLPGVFTNNPYPQKINASLWTIKYELVCYVILGAIAVVCAAGRRRAIVFGTLAGMCLIVSSVETISGTDAAQMLANLLRKPGFASAIGDRIHYFALFGLAFFAGAQIAEMRIRPWKHWTINLLAFLIVVMGFVTTAIAPLVPLAVTLLSIFVGYQAPAWASTLLNGRDYSYGVYIYAFPVQQSLVQIFGSSLGYGLTLLLAGGATLFLSVISWHLIERPSLVLKRSLPGEKAVVLQ